MSSIAWAESSATVSLTRLGSGQARGAGCADGRVRDEHVVAHLAHDFCLERRRAGEAHGASAELLAGDARRLMRFHVRTQPKSVRGCIVRRPVEITCEPIEIDDGRWRFELGDRQRHSDHDPHSSGDGK